MVEEFTNNISAAGQCMQLERASDVTSALHVVDELQLLDCAPPHSDRGDDDVRMRRGRKSAAKQIGHNSQISFVWMLVCIHGCL